MSTKSRPTTPSHTSKAIRLITTDDVADLTRLLQRNREFLTPWSPVREDSYFLVETQLELATQNIRAHSLGTMLPLVILDDDSTIVGQLNLNGVTRGAFQSAALGYWVSETVNGRGVATRAVAEVIDFAFSGLGLHRLQAETLFHNLASQRVLTKNLFQPYGVAQDYLRIDGRWQDHILYQLITDGSSR